MRWLASLLLFPSVAFAACETGYFPSLEPEQTHKMLFCDTAADVPTSGLFDGDPIYLKDTKAFYQANSGTTYSTPALESPLTLQVPNGSTPTAGDCDAAGEAGRIWYDSDATSQKRFYGCEGVAGWKLQGDGDSGGAPAWGSVTGTLANQTDLQTALDAKQAADADLTDLADGALTPSKVQAFPVGSVFISVVSTDPGTLLGYGTWSAIGTGRMLVGIDTGDTDFDVVKETGGAKTKTIAQANLPDISTGAGTSHNHTQDAHLHVLAQLRDATTGGSTTNIALSADTSSTTGTKNGASATATNQAEAAHTHSLGGSGTAMNVVNPYYIVYMWERTA